VIRGGLLVAALAVAGCQPAARPDDPAAYAVRIPVVPAAGGGLQRLTLPAAALVAVQRPDRGDVRLFDANGRAQPLAVAPAAAGEAAVTAPLPTYPVLGTARLEASDAVRVTLGADRVARVESSAGNSAARQATVAALIDARGVDAPAAAIEFNANLPAERLVTISAAASADLRNWEAIGERTLFRPREGQPLGGSRIDLGGADLRGRFLRLTWSDPGPITIESARVVTVSSSAPTAVVVNAGEARLLDAHDARFRVPFATTVTAVRLVPGAANSVVPVRLFGRGDREAPWQPLAAAVLLGADGPGNRIAIEPAGAREYRLEADARTTGFSRAPRLTLELAPVELLARFDGRAPYVLAVGQARAPAAYLTTHEIAPAAPIGALPRATASAAPPRLDLSDGAWEAFDWRKVGLWAVLLAATAALAVAVVRLLKLSRPQGGGS